VPNTHLDEFRDELAHGEILLMIDTVESRVGGFGWGTKAFGL
jgi:hypothetical protein